MFVGAMNRGRSWVPLPPSGIVPGLALDMRGQRALQSGAGASLAAILNVVRATTANDEQPNGALVSVGNNVPRYGGGRGLLIERVATNNIRNSTNVGAVAGTPGTDPTNWVINYGTGLNKTIVGSGTVNGIPYIDVRLFGTLNASATAFATELELANVIAANNTTLANWTSSFYVALVAGSFTGIANVMHSVNFLQADGVTSAQAIHKADIKASINGTLQRFSSSFTATAATVAFARPRFRMITGTSGDVVDITLRIGGVQFEAGPLATSFIPTSTVAVTRNGEQIKITGTPLTAGIGGGTAFTMFAEYEAYVSVDASYLGGVVNDGAPAFNNSIYASLSTSRATSAGVVSGGVGTFVNAAATANAPPTLNRLAMRVAANDAAISHNGAVAITDPSITLPAATMDRIVLGSAPHSIGTQSMNGRITRFAAWPSLLSNADLQGIV